MFISHKGPAGLGLFCSQLCPDEVHAKEKYLLNACITNESQALLYQLGLDPAIRKPHPTPPPDSRGSTRWKLTFLLVLVSPRNQLWVKDSSKSSLFGKWRDLRGRLVCRSWITLLVRADSEIFSNFVIVEPRHYQNLDYINLKLIIKTKHSIFKTHHFLIILPYLAIIDALELFTSILCCSMLRYCVSLPSSAFGGVRLGAEPT